MWRRLPLALSGMALVVAVLGSAPYAGAHGVLHAVFAHNSGRVDGSANALRITAIKVADLTSSEQP